MLFDKYEQLSEDAQRLLCYYAEAGLGTNKRMDEHLYILRKYGFPTFNGQAAHYSRESSRMMAATGTPTHPVTASAQMISCLPCGICTNVAKTC